MQHVILSLLLIINLSISLFASNATTQEHLVSLSPVEGADSVKPKSFIKVAFDREIIARSVKKHTIELKPINPKGKKISAKITIDEKSTLVFTPNELLQEGEYRVKINPIKLKADKDDYQLSSFMKKVFYWLCSWFYDDISECPLYKKFYKAPSFIKTKLIQYTFSVVDKPELLSIKLNQTSLELNEGESAQLNAVANYDDNTTKDITQEALWNITDPSVASIDTNATLNAVQEGSAQITATLENITSQTLLLSVRKVINGHTLPPMPDETLNNSTLLGIDSNKNGVRDDVERWIYTYYSKPIEHAVFMQSARAYQIVIQEPEKALITMQYLDDAVGCEMYYRLEALNANETMWLDENGFFEDESKDIIFNTSERFLAYKKYNQTLSGGVYSGNQLNTLKNKCDFNSTTLIKFP